jgi:hypothetical protein
MYTPITRVYIYGYGMTCNKPATPWASATVPLGGSKMIYRFSIYSQAEAMLLLELAKEHKGSVTVKCNETSFFTEIAVYPTYPQLLEYFEYMLAKLREKQRQLEQVYQRTENGEEAPKDPFLLWSKDLSV